MMISRSDRNRGRYVRKKLPKYLAVGAGGGALTGGLATKNVGGAIAGGLVGAAAGGLGATVRGESKAEDEGHGRDNVMRKTAGRIDKVKGKGSNAYGRANKREQDRRREAIEREKLREQRRARIEQDRRDRDRNDSLNRIANNMSYRN